MLATYARGANDLVLAQAMHLLGKAAAAYHRIEHIDFYSVLLVMADGARTSGDDEAAHALFARVANDLASPRSAELAEHTGFLRGRGFVGLGEIALARDDEATASTRFEAAANCLIGSGYSAALPLLSELADVLEGKLADPDAAAQIRTWMARIDDGQPPASGASK